MTKHCFTAVIQEQMQNAVMIDIRPSDWSVTELEQQIRSGELHHSANVKPASSGQETEGAPDGEKEVKDLQQSNKIQPWQFKSWN